MTDKQLHDLAVAYAHAKLVKVQLHDTYDSDSTNEEIREFLKFYHFALIHLPEEDEDADISSLC